MQVAAAGDTKKHILPSVRGVSCRKTSHLVSPAFVMKPATGKQKMERYPRSRSISFAPVRQSRKTSESQIARMPWCDAEPVKLRSAADANCRVVAPLRFRPLVCMYPPVRFEFVMALLMATDAAAVAVVIVFSRCHLPPAFSRAET